MTVRTYGSGAVAVHLGDCLDVLRALPDASVHAVVTDPPYELGFMGRAWDATGIAYSVELWRECLRVLKPGGHLLAFGGTRTHHRLACAIEDAGFEIRDSITWLYGSGFPKSMNISKAIDKARDDSADTLRVTSWLKAAAAAASVSRADVDQHMGTSDMGGWWLSDLRHRCQVPTVEQWEKLRELIGFGDEMDALVWHLNGRKGTPGEAWHERPEVGTGYRVRNPSDVQVAGLSTGAFTLTAAATDASRQWEGWGTALKPAHEPIVVARRPLSGTVAANVLQHGAGGLNIDGCRVGVGGSFPGLNLAVRAIKGGIDHGHVSATAATAGRWPTNVILSHSALLDGDGSVAGDACADGCVPGCAVAELDAQGGMSESRASAGRQTPKGGTAAYGNFAGTNRVAGYDDSGGASRFFPVFRYQAKAPARERPKTSNGTAHPTVKPLALMRWLVRLVTPPGGTVLDPFAGSGTTAEACALEGFACVAAEKDPQYLPLIEARLARALPPDSTGPRCNCTHCRPKETAE